MRSLKLIVWPQEVSEVTEVKMKKKILSENPKIANFSLTEMLYTLVYRIDVHARLLI